MPFTQHYFARVSSIHISVGYEASLPVVLSVFSFSSLRALEADDLSETPKALWKV
jgi:hypothetical protein